MRIGLSTGYRELYWGKWFEAKQLGGSERIPLRLSIEFARMGHEVTLRLPYQCDEFTRDGVHFVSEAAVGSRYDLLLSFDDFRIKDLAEARVLVACRSDPPEHTDFDEIIFLSQTHAQLMGHPDRPYVGGGVSLADYEKPRERIPRRVICNSSPDRCAAAASIGKSFDFVHSYRPVPGMPPTVELTRTDLVELQQTAQVFIYPLDPRRPSDFFSMATLEAMAAGTPVLVSNADSMPELWSEAAYKILPLPIHLGEWVWAIEELLERPKTWQRQSEKVRKIAEQYDWPKVAQRYLKVALNGNV